MPFGSTTFRRFVDCMYEAWTMRFGGNSASFWGFFYKMSISVTCKSESPLEGLLFPDSCQVCVRFREVSCKRKLAECLPCFFVVTAVDEQNAQTSASTSSLAEAIVTVAASAAGEVVTTSTARIEEEMEPVQGYVSIIQASCCLSLTIISSLLRVVLMQFI